MDTISFEVLGNPIPLKRHRRRGRRAYDPNAETKSTFLAWCKQHRPDEPWSGAIMVQMDFYFKHPQKHYDKDGRLRFDAATHKQTTPDIDNLIKFVMDALNGIFWLDDSRIVSIRATKLYAQNPKTEVSMKMLKL